jgi:transcriptional regulator with XRE-family HTH domain
MTPQEKRLYKAIGESIKRQRIALKRTQYNVGYDIGISQAQWSKIEAGKVVMMAHSILDLARIGIDISEFFNVSSLMSRFSEVVEDRN